MDDARAAGFELAPKFHHVHFQGVGEPVVALVPDLLVDAGARQNLAGVAQEEDQQRLLFGGEVESVARALGAVGGEIDAQVEFGEHGPGAGGGSSGEGADAGQQFLESERLAQVVVGPAVEPPDPIRDGIAGG